MPYAAPHRVVTVFGDAWTAQEEWSYSLRLADDPSDDPSPAQMTSLLAAATTFHQTASLFSAGTRLLGVKVAPQDVNGLYPAGQEAVEVFAATPPAGAGGYDGCFPQITACVSLQTPVRRGLGSKGRFYPPATTLPVVSDGRMSGLSQSRMIDAAVLLLDAINNVGIGLVSVVSKGSQVGGADGPGVTRTVTGIRVGRVLDTQRRRRESITEEYVEALLDPS